MFALPPTAKLALLPAAAMLLLAAHVNAQDIAPTIQVRSPTQDDTAQV